MNVHTVAEQTTTLATLHELRELIAALDRRVPQVARVGEVGIARAAAGLREEAARRIEALEAQMHATTPMSVVD